LPIADCQLPIVPIVVLSAIRNPKSTIDDVSVPILGFRIAHAGVRRRRRD